MRLRQRAMTKQLLVQILSGLSRYLKATTEIRRCARKITTEARRAFTV